MKELIVPLLSKNKPSEQMKDWFQSHPDTFTQIFDLGFVKGVINNKHRFIKINNRNNLSDFEVYHPTHIQELFANDKLIIQTEILKEDVTYLENFNETVIQKQLA